MIDQFARWVCDTSFADSIRSSATGLPMAGKRARAGYRPRAGLHRRGGPAPPRGGVPQAFRDPACRRRACRSPWIAFVVATITGLAMFTSNATEYIHNTPFQLKMLMLVLAGLNMLVFQLITYRGVGQWDEARVPPAARFAGGFFVVGLDQYRRLRSMDRIHHRLLARGGLRA